MNKEQSPALWRQGRDAWNAWAKAMLDRRAEMERDGTWASHRKILSEDEPGNEATGAWMNEAAADFQEHVFEEQADFSSFSFAGSARFNQATFQQDAVFDNASFSGHAGFVGATFSEGAWFQDATFSEHTWFEGATFSGNAGFNRATFSGNAGFKRTTFSGGTRFDSATFIENALFESVSFSGRAWFVSVTFNGYAGFGRATFNGAAGFFSAMFRKNVWFQDATFSGDAWFDSVTFSGHARFGKVTFSRHARFSRVTFSGRAWFDSTTFSGDALFGQAKFGGYTNFTTAMFEKLADFLAARGENAFTLEGATFAKVPEFTQAHFAEAPRLDNVSIPEVGGVARFFLPMLRGVDPDPGLSSRYRALKRLAIQAHDQARELDYSANELKALRGHPDSPLLCPLNLLRKDKDGRRLPVWPGGLRGTMRFWFGLGYEVLSNFGRSIALPLFWWVLATATFARAYLGQAISADRCASGEGTPWSAALGLSIRKALPFAGIASSEKLNQIYACLYGIHGESARLAVLPDRFTPVIPDAVDYLGMVQLVFSILLLFLFLLAVRSHFRIR